jgi:DNA-binding GntR family transcriptional regulator
MRADIFRGDLEPGARLKFHALCERYATSVGAAREALTRLAAENLVTVSPRQGYRVVSLTRDDLADLVQARIEVEALALRLAIEHGDTAWEGRAVAAMHVLERTPMAADGDGSAVPGPQWVRAHTEYHRTLIEACPNRRLLAFAEKLRDEALLYQMWSVSATRDPDRRRIEEHRNLLDATLARDAERADQLLRAHLNRTANLVLGLADDELDASATTPRAAVS